MPAPMITTDARVKSVFPTCSAGLYPPEFVMVMIDRGKFQSDRQMGR